MNTNATYLRKSLLVTTALSTLVVGILLAPGSSLYAGEPAGNEALAAEIEGIIGEVEQLVDSGLLDDGAGLSLIATLETTRTLLLEGVPDNAIAGTIVASLNQISALIESGRLDETRGDELFFALVDVLRALNA